MKCRSQADIDSKKSIAQALQSEEDFFKTNLAYANLQNLTCTKMLSRKLSSLLESHIFNLLPDIQKCINKQIKAKDEQIKELGEGVPEEEHKRRQLMTEQTINLSDSFNAIMKNKGVYAESSS